MNCSKKKWAASFREIAMPFRKKVAQVEERSETNINNFNFYQRMSLILGNDEIRHKWEFLKFCSDMKFCFPQIKWGKIFKNSTNEVFLVARSSSKIFGQGSATFSIYSFFLSGRLWNEIMDGTEMHNTFVFLFCCYDFFSFFAFLGFWETFQQQQKN